MKFSENWFCEELCSDLPALPGNSIALLLLLFLPSIWKLSAPWLVSRHPKLMGIAMRVLANGRHKKWSRFYFCLFLFLWRFSSQNKPRYDCVQHISSMLFPLGMTYTKLWSVLLFQPIGLISLVNWLFKWPYFFWLWKKWQESNCTSGHGMQCQGGGIKEEEDSASQKGKRSLAKPTEMAWVICKSAMRTQDML